MTLALTMNEMTSAKTKTGEMTVGSIQFTGKYLRGCLRPRFRFFSKPEKKVFIDLEKNQTKTFENTTTEEEKEETKKRLSQILLNKDKMASGNFSDDEEDEEEDEEEVEYDSTYIPQGPYHPDCVCGAGANPSHLNCVCGAGANYDDYVGAYVGAYDDDYDVAYDGAYDVAYDGDYDDDYDDDYDGAYDGAYYGAYDGAYDDDYVVDAEAEAKADAEYEDLMDFAYYPTDDSAEGIKWRLYEKYCEEKERMECLSEGRKFLC
jgi:hypothetical protein